jgi:predicted naringenin-chalcone synthase
VLLACVELCSLHRREDPCTDHLVSQSLFGDGAGALVLGRLGHASHCLAELDDARTTLVPGTRSALTWQLGDDGFDVRLSPRLPALIERALPEFLGGWLRAAGGERPAAWAVHPGGAAILRAVQRALGVERDALASAWSVLRRLGNTSSAAILYVLEEELARTREGSDGLMLGFGPGLTLEALAFRRGAQAS